ncbi:MAG: TetR/AcrR family transcriptional regulator [Bacteroidales bacterium]|nr:TetR/AcrR family transcriptional regulator [Bacteroidales bacterium]
MTDQEKDYVREQIVNAAAVVFGRYGYKKTTMDEIGMAAGKGKTAIYYYFKNKEDVFKAVVEKEAAQLEQSLLEAIANKETPEEKLKAYVYARMRAMLSLSNFYDAMKNELLDHLPFINNIRKEVDNKELELVKSIIQEGLEKDIFQVKDLNFTAVTIVTTLKGLEIPLFLENKVEDLTMYIDHLIYLICYGLFKR